MPEESIKAALAALMEAIKKPDGPALTARMAELESLVAQHRTGLHPQLVHFIERRSYPKALMFLGGDSSIPAGSCGGRR